MKLADFGCSKRVASGSAQEGASEGLHTMAGTVQFMAPEVMRKESAFGRKADVWSLGMAVVEMLTGKPTWSNPATAVYKACFTDEVPPLPAHVSDDARDFMTRCFRRDPAARPSARELLRHAFVAEPAAPAGLARELLRPRTQASRQRHSGVEGAVGGEQVEPAATLGSTEAPQQHHHGPWSSLSRLHATADEAWPTPPQDSTQEGEAGAGDQSGDGRLHSGGRGGPSDGGAALEAQLVAALAARALQGAHPEPLSPREGEAGSRVATDFQSPGSPILPDRPSPRTPLSGRDIPDLPSAPMPTWQRDMLG